MFHSFGLYGLFGTYPRHVSLGLSPATAAAQPQQQPVLPSCSSNSFSSMLFIAVTVAALILFLP
jgi:hypothetical protein